jgi:hypothetical protein
MSDPLTVKAALNSVTFCKIIQEFDLFDDVIDIEEKFIEAFNKDPESLKRYRITKEKQGNVCRELITEVISHDKSLTLEKFCEQLPNPSSKYIISKIKKAQSKILEEATAAAMTVKTNDLKVFYQDKVLCEIDLSKFSPDSQRKVKQIQLFYRRDFNQVVRLKEIFLEEQLKIIDLSGDSDLAELKKELKRGEILNIPLFIVFDEFTNDFLINEDEQMNTNDFNHARLSTFYRIIYQEYLKRFNNTRFFLLNTVNLEEINFQHIWLLHETTEENVDFEYIDPVFISNNSDNLKEEDDTLKKFLKFEMETIMKMKNIDSNEESNINTQTGSQKKINFSQDQHMFVEV